jgi:hypothetical protein
MVASYEDDMLPFLEDLYIFLGERLLAEVEN